MRQSILALVVALLAIPSARATPAHDARLVALSAALAQVGIGLETRGGGVVTATAGCRDVVDRLQPSSCYRCILADDRDVTDDVLERIKAVVDRYPTEMLVQADIHTLKLCRRLDRVAAQHPYGGISDLDTRHAMIVVAKPEFLANIVNHELFHMIESAFPAGMDEHDAQWERANPVGFSYDAGPSASETKKSRPAGFVNWYAASALQDDRASTFEYMMAEPEALCEMATNDPIVHAKVQIISARLKMFTGGYDLMDTLAPCVRSAGWR
jgi:hypothetical protein